MPCSSLHASSAIPVRASSVCRLCTVVISRGSRMLTALAVTHQPDLLEPVHALNDVGAEELGLLRQPTLLRATATRQAGPPSSVGQSLDQCLLTLHITPYQPCVHEISEYCGPSSSPQPRNHPLSHDTDAPPAPFPHLPSFDKLVEDVGVDLLHGQARRLLSHPVLEDGHERLAQLHGRVRLYRIPVTHTIPHGSSSLNR